MRHLLTALAACFCGAPAFSAPISFSSAVATYQQGAPYTVASAIDGNTGGGQGWGVFSGQFANQAAVFRTTTPANAATLRVTIQQNLGSAHLINEFRLSVTSDATPSLAGAWTVLTPTSMSSTATTLTAVGDHIRSTGGPAVAVFTVNANAPIQGITGFRLEVFPFDYDGAAGLAACLGRATNGNFVLSEFQAETNPTTTGNVALNKPITASAALWAGFPVTNLVDGNPSSFTHPLAASQTLGFFYELDLGQLYALSQIAVRNRNDGCCPERLSNYELQLYDVDAGDGEGPGSLLWSGLLRADGTNSGNGGIDTATAASGSGSFRGRYLRLVNHSNAAYNPQAAEIEVYGTLLPVVESFVISGDDTISSGQNTMLSWSVQNSTSVTISPAVGTVAASGSATVTPATTTLYTLTATNAVGSVQATVQVGVDVTLAPPVLNEFAADNTQLEDEDGDASDWIELRNPNAYRLEISGYALTDDSTLARRWQIPAVTLQPNGFLVIFASGKNRANPAATLHTDFQLASGGEFLALLAPDGSTIVQQFAPNFPSQKENVSYGLPAGGGAPGYLKPMTPRAPNGATAFAGIVRDTHFSVQRGFFDTPFTVALTCDTPDAQIRYTTDGTNVTETTGAVYSAPVNITTTTVLRVAAFKAQWAPSNVDTQTYIFPAHVLAQPALPPGLPATWDGRAADYEMDPQVVNNPTYAPQMQQALKSIRTLSVVLNPADLWSPTNGIYIFPEQRGVAWERATSIELINPPNTQNPSGSTAFRESCGLRIYGFGWRSHDASKKHAFRLKFKSEYGATKLREPLFPGWPVEEFDNIVLRSQGSRGWNDFRFPDITQSQYIHDSFARDSAAAMGKADGPATYVHLYLNGLYWGLYNVVLRPDASFGEAHFGGREEDYDALNARVGALEVVDGNLNAWNQVLALTQAGLANAANYAQLAQLVDLDDLCDYILFHIYATNHDGPNNQNNFRAVRRRDASGRWRFFFWDMEYTLWDHNENTLATVVTSGQTVYPVFHALRQNAEFRLRFADHVHRHCFNNGALMPAAAIARWQARATEIYYAILGESARWGDARREPPYTRNVEWEAERTRLTTQYFPNRTNVMLNHLRSAGLYPNVVAPTFNQHGGAVPLDFGATLSAPAGQIFYTLDGSDPRTGTAYGGTLTLSTPGYITINARAQVGSVWSALTSATFVVASVPASSANLVISEIHYHPASGTEFVELMNISSGHVDLSGARFSDGIAYTFPAGTVLAPGAWLVLTESEYSGRLEDSGDRLTLLASDNAVIRDFSYDDAPPWPNAPDGNGPSLVLIAPQTNPDHADAASWRPSAAAGGNPGTSDATLFSGDPSADIDGDGLTAFIEHAFGSSDSIAGPTPLALGSNADHLTLSFPRGATADDAGYVVEFSTDLATWQTGPAFVEPLTLGPPAALWRAVRAQSADARQFLRLRVNAR